MVRQKINTQNTKEPKQTHKQKPKQARKQTWKHKATPDSLYLAPSSTPASLNGRQHGTVLVAKTLFLPFDSFSVQIASMKSLPLCERSTWRALSEQGNLKGRWGTEAHWLSGWPQKSPNFMFTTKMVFPKSLKFMNSGPIQKGRGWWGFKVMDAWNQQRVMEPLHFLKESAFGSVHVVSGYHVVNMTHFGGIHSSE